MQTILIGLLVWVLIFTTQALEAKEMIADTTERLTDVQCFVNNDYKRLLFRGLMKTGQPDPNAKQNLIAATAIDCTLYLSPCFKCGNPRKQIQDTCTAIYGTGFVYRPYIVVEDPQDWSNDLAANRAFVEEMADEVIKQRTLFSFTISLSLNDRSTSPYPSASLNATQEGGERSKCFDNQRFRSTKFDWEKIVGPDYTKWSSRLLWYVSTDKKPDFSDFKPFGGWKTPLIKQYDQNKLLCDHTVNFDVQGARFAFEPSKVKITKVE